MNGWGGVFAAQMRHEKRAPSWLGYAIPFWDGIFRVCVLVVVVSNRSVLPSLKLTAKALKNGGWNTTLLLLGRPIFRGENVSFREGSCLV